MSEKYEVKLSIKAKDDLKGSVLYIKNELNEPNISRRYSKLIRNEIQSLENMPQKFAIIDDDDIKDLNIRKINIKNYIVFYRINEEKRIVNIERVLYGASDWLNKLYL